MAHTHFLNTKNAVLLLLLFVTGHATTMAQSWTASAPENGGTYYLYNIGMRGFLVGGHGRAMLAPVPNAGQTITLEQDGDNTDQFRIDTHNLRDNGKTDQWMVENWDDDWVYIDVNKSHTMHKPWLFTEVDGQERVYYISIVGGTDNGRRLEMDSRNNGVPDLNNRAGVNMYTRSTRQSSAGGNLVAENDHWMLVTPEDYTASLAGTTDFTARVGLAQGDWTGASEFGTSVRVTTADGRSTGIPAFYGSSAIGDKITQTVTGIDNGIYEVKVFAHSHNERKDYGTAAPGSNVTGYTDVAYVYAESGDSRVQTWIGARGRDPLGWTLAEFHTPYTLSDVTVKNGQIKIGLALARENMTQWQAIQIYSLVRTGDLPLTEKIEAYESALELARTTAEDTDIPTGFRTQLLTVIGEWEHVSDSDGEALDTAAEALTHAVQTAEEGKTLLADLLSRISLLTETIEAQTEVYNDDSGTASDLLDANVDAALSKARAASDKTDIVQAEADVRQAIAVFVKTTNIPGRYFDLTSLLVNPGFETSRDGGWTYSHDGGAFNWVDGNTCVEFFNCTYNLSQTLTDMPAGTYKVLVNGFYRPNNEYGPEDHVQANVDGYLYLSGGTPVPLQVLRNNANNIPSLHQQMNVGEYLNEAYAVMPEDAPLTLGVRCDRQRRLYSWTLIDDIRLLYTVSDEALFLQPYNDALAEAQAVDTSLPMNAEVRDLLLAAIAADETLNKDNSATLHDATLRLQQTTVTALASQKAYAEAVAALDRIDAEMAQTNVVTNEATAVFLNYRTAYELGFLTDEEATGMMRRTFRDGVNRELGNTFDEYLLSAWKEGDVQMRDYDGVLYINTWSTEPDVEGFTYPFYEIADGYNTSTVSHTLTATVTNVEPGYYEVTLWARTRIKQNGEYQIGAYPNGITFQLNDGEPVLLKGEEYGSFRADHYTMGGTVGNDGLLRLVLTIPSSEMGTWLSFRNIHYAPAEQPTGITPTQSLDGKHPQQAVYDLQGRRVTTPAKGTYIVGNKKVLYK